MIADAPADTLAAAAPSTAGTMPTTTALYAEAMRLGTMARACFDAGGDGAAARAGLRPEVRVTVATESLRVTSRLLEIVAALIVRQAGGVAPVLLRDNTPVSNRLDGPARAIADDVRDLYLRIFVR